MFYIIVLAAIVGLIGTDIFAPSLPAIANHFHEVPAHAQLTISLFLAGFAASQLFYGPLSDRIGRRLPLIFGLSIFTVGSMLCVIAPSFIWLCGGRIIQGVGAGAGLSLARVILRDCYKDTTLAIKSAQVGIFVSLTPALAPFVGGILQQKFGYQSAFILMLGYGLVLLALLVFRFEETLQIKDQTLTLEQTLKHYRLLLRNSHFIKYVFIAGIAFTAIVLYASVMPFIIQVQMKLSAFDNGVILLLSALGVSLGSLISSRIVHTTSPQRLVKIGLILYVVNGLFLMASSSHLSLIALIPAIFMITIACGFIFPNAIALCFSQIDGNIGIAGAIYGATQITVSTLFILLLNSISHQGQEMLGAFYLSMGFMGFLLLGLNSNMLSVQR